ncbi:MAG: nuclear transport factor 2 family protein [Devosia nanyangense]|uniref:Nuclear transport factor 2 family protein n=1 Tax=Devosia nanyangense TaxID=1228055 RepID=A0A933L2T5_9HYPH|nr:nuclear transport factor 2 family protein [Devosia nanyangense]
MTGLECVEEQLAAYNARDLARFLACFHDDVRSFRMLEMALVLDGKAEFGAFYARERFSRPCLRAEIVNRIVLGETIIDHERIFGIAAAPVEMVVMFVARDGLIARVFAIPAK